jgi:hypothetical protein
MGIVYRSQDASVQSTGFAHAVAADAVTMWRRRRPLSLTTIGVGAVNRLASVHSFHLRIGSVGLNRCLQGLPPPVKT